jgi:hypothetical protein
MTESNLVQLFAYFRDPKSQQEFGMAPPEESLRLVKMFSKITDSAKRAEIVAMVEKIAAVSANPDKGQR